MHFLTTHLQPNLADFQKSNKITRNDNSTFSLVVRVMATLRCMLTYGARFIDEQERTQKRSPIYSLPYTDLITGTTEFYLSRMRVRLCVRIVCVSICPCVIVNFDAINTETSFLVLWYILTITSWSGLSIKGMGSRSMSHNGNVY